MDLINVDKPHWQVACWKLARANKSFELVGCNDRHQQFGDHLCSTFAYEVKRGLKKSLFTPSVSKGSLVLSSMGPIRHQTTVKRLTQPKKE
jgi:hypothetical protein